MKDNLGCIDPHGYYPFPASREVCPKCIAIRASRPVPVFSPRHGLRYRWWRDIPWDLVVTCVTTLFIFMVATLILGAWVFDWKAWW